MATKHESRPSPSGASRRSSNPELGVDERTPLVPCDSGITGERNEPTNKCSLAFSSFRKKYPALAVGNCCLLIGFLCLAIALYDQVFLDSTEWQPDSKCFEGGPSPCAISGLVGDTNRSDFAAKRDENLILYDDFTSRESIYLLWQPDHTLFGEGNGGFAYYTGDNPKNLAIHKEQGGSLGIHPGLFADLGPIETAAGTYDAEDVMMGNCTPFPDCATLDLNNMTSDNKNPCTIDDFAGCKRIGTPLVALNPATSGRVTTRDTFHFTYGRVEARMRLPAGDWLWPAYWLMPVDNQFYGLWPDGGEMDLMEARGNEPGYLIANDTQEGGRDVFVTSLHFAGNAWWHTQATAKASQVLKCGHNQDKECDFSMEFFTMGLYWSDDRMYAYILDENTGEEHVLWDVDASKGFGPDDAPMGSRVPPLGKERDQEERTPVEGAGPYVNSPNPNAPFDKPFYLIFNLAVGGAQSGCPDPNFWGTNAIWCTHRRNDSEMERSKSASTVFWETRDEWLPTWEEAKAEGRDAFLIDWVKVWQ